MPWTRRERLLGVELLKNDFLGLLFYWSLVHQRWQRLHRYAAEAPASSGSHAHVCELDWEGEQQAWLSSFSEARRLWILWNPSVNHWNREWPKALALCVLSMLTWHAQQMPRGGRGGNYSSMLVDFPDTLARHQILRLSVFSFRPARPARSEPRNRLLSPSRRQQLRLPAAPRNRPTHGSHCLSLSQQQWLFVPKGMSILAVSAPGGPTI